MATVPFKIRDMQCGGFLEGIVTIGPHFVEIGIAGFGSATAAPGYGRPVALEFYDGRVRLLVNADYNDENPQVIDLEGARDPDPEALVLKDK